MQITKIAEYFDTHKFESSASKIWTIDQISLKSNWKTSLYFVPESDITHFNFFFELKKLPFDNFEVFVTRERNLIQTDLECSQKNAKLMIQLLLIKGEEQINVKKYIVNLFETDRLKYDQFQKVIKIDQNFFLAAKEEDSLKIRIGGGILKEHATIADAFLPDKSDYNCSQILPLIPQNMTFSSTNWTIAQFKQNKVSSHALALTAPVLGITTNLHLDLYRHEDTNRLTVGIRRERFFIKDDVVDAFKQLKVYLNFSFTGVNALEWHFQEVVMSFFENERSNYGHHVKEFIVEEDQIEKEGILVNDQLKIKVKAAVVA